MANTQKQAFQGFIGKRVRLNRAAAEIVDVQVHGRSVCFVGREPGSDQEFLVPLRFLLEHVVDETSVRSAEQS